MTMHEKLEEIKKRKTEKAENPFDEKASIIMSSSNKSVNNIIKDSNDLLSTIKKQGLQILEQNKKIEDLEEGSKAFETQAKDLFEKYKQKCDEIDKINKIKNDAVSRENNLKKQNNHLILQNELLTKQLAKSLEDQRKNEQDQNKWETAMEHIQTYTTSVIENVKEGRKLVEFKDKIVLKNGK